MTPTYSTEEQVLYDIVTVANLTGYAIWNITDREYLRDRYGNIRIFATRNSARKRISRERRGSFHA